MSEAGGWQGGGRQHCTHSADTLIATHTVPRSKKIQSHETSKRMPLGGWWGYVASWNMRQKNIGWENFEKLTKSF